MTAITLKRLTGLAALFALANPLIAFAAVNFEIANANADPMIFVRAVSQPFWILVGMPLFFLTDSLGWYVLPTYLIRQITTRHSLPRAAMITRLAWVYTVIGNFGVFVFAGGYYLYVAGVVQADLFIQASRLSYDWIWGSVNNIVGSLMFINIGLGLFSRSRWWIAASSILLGSVMALSSLLFVGGVLLHNPGTSNLSSSITTPVYLLLFPCAVLAFWPLWRSEPSPA